MTMKLTPTQMNAIRWLKERNGSGVIDRLGRVLAAGEIVGRYQDDELVEAVGSATWSRLFSLGMVEPDGPNRLRITDLGHLTLRETKRPRRRAS